jgi:threonine dehydratase
MVERTVAIVIRADVEAAAVRIRDQVRRTPTVEIDGNLFFKLEYLQFSGSFKMRGATNRILAAQEAGALPAAGVITASGGNAGLAVATAAARLGVPAEVYVPVNAPPVKVARLGALGATVRQVGASYGEAYRAATVRAAGTGALFCHAYDQPEVVAGQGTLALELPPVDTVLVAVGGGGLMGGIATALDGTHRVVAVEPAGAPTLHAALAAGGPVEVPIDSIAADSLGAHRIGTIGYAVAVRTGVRSVLVDDESIAAARRRLWDGYRIVVEYGAAAAYAALLTGAYRPSPGERVAVILCGANTDPALDLTARTCSPAHAP